MKPHRLHLDVVADSPEQVVALLRLVAAQLEDDRLPDERVMVRRDMRCQVVYRDLSRG